jgi:hypothetical protein
MKTIKIKLGYICVNNGDGSASVHFYPSYEDAQLAEEFKAAHKYYEGCGEDSASYVKIEYDLDSKKIISGVNNMKNIEEWVKDGKPDQLNYNSKYDE